MAKFLCLKDALKVVARDRCRHRKLNTSHSAQSRGTPFLSGSFSLKSFYLSEGFSSSLHHPGHLPLGGLFYQHTETTTDYAGHSLNYSSAVHFRCDEFLPNRNYSNQNKHAKHSEMAIGRLKLTPCVRPPVAVDAEAWLGPARHSEAAWLQPQPGSGYLG